MKFAVGDMIGAPQMNRYFKLLKGTNYYPLSRNLAQLYTIALEYNCLSLYPCIKEFRNVRRRRMQWTKKL